MRIINSVLITSVVVLALSSDLLAQQREEFRNPDGRLTGYAEQKGNQTRYYDPVGRPRGTDVIKPNGTIERRTPDGRLLGVVVPTR